MGDLVKRLGQRIRFLRKEKGLSQEQLGNLAGIHTNYIGQIERGEKNVTIESLEKIVDGLGISMEQLFHYLDPANNDDDLKQLIELLFQRPVQDRAFALNLIKSVFDWEYEKNKSKD
jgi:transcriptional regulator with XRE-family HTH domain